MQREVKQRLTMNSEVGGITDANELRKLASV